MTHSGMIKYVYHPMNRAYKSNKGLSERQIRKELIKNSWEVWRGGFINASRCSGLYPNVEKKYARLAELIDKHAPGKLEELQYLCAVHHGMPDYICYREGRFKFVECKFKGEQPSSAQKKCIPKLISMGFSVEIHKLVSHATKDRLAYQGKDFGKRTVKEKQLRLRLKW